MSTQIGHDHSGPEACPAGSIRIVETFGPTIQGEGPDVGRAAKFLRLAGCNLTCTWCDTAFSWDQSRPDPERPWREVPVIEVLRELDPRAATPSDPAPAVTHLVVTGGEPMLQARELVDLVAPLRTLGWSIEVETSGTVSPAPLMNLIDRFNVSPKLRNSGVVERARIRPQVLYQFADMPGAVFKFVIEQASELDEVADLVVDLGLPGARVFVMAQGTSGVDVLRRSRDLVDAVAARGWGLTPRWHTLLWDDQPGR